MANINKEKVMHTFLTNSLKSYVGTGRNVVENCGNPSMQSIRVEHC